MIVLFLLFLRWGDWWRCVVVALIDRQSGFQSDLLCFALSPRGEGLSQPEIYLFVFGILSFDLRRARPVVRTTCIESDSGTWCGFARETERVLKGVFDGTTSTNSSAYSPSVPRHLNPTIMATTYDVEYVQDSGLTLAHCLRPRGSPAPSVLLSKINLNVASHPRVTQLRSENHGLDCGALKCRHTREGHHEDCAVRKAKLSTLSALVRQCNEDEDDPMREIVTASSVGWRAVEGSDGECEREVLIQVPLGQVSESGDVRRGTRMKSALAPMRFIRQADSEQGYSSQ